MFNRPLLFVGVLVAAFVVPYVLLDKNLSQTAKAQLNRLTGSGKTGGAASSLEHLKFPWLEGETKPAAAVAGGAAPIVMPAPVSLEEALRFDVTPPWVTARWPNVSTVAGDGKYMGLRVPLVTGTDPGDVAGSLTYYFDDRHELARITLLGITGNESRIVAVATQQFGLKPVPTLAAGLYVAGDPAKPTSSLRVSHLPIVRAANTYARAEVALDLRRGDASVASTNTVKVQADPPKILPKDFRRW